MKKIMKGEFIEHRGQKLPIQQVANSIKNLQPYQDLMVSAMISGGAACLESDEKYLDLFEQIYLYTGFDRIPEHQADRFVEIVREYLMNNKYSDWLISEIFLAFYLNVAMQVKSPNGYLIERFKPSNNKLTLEYVDGVMSRYADLRLTLEGMLKNAIEGY